MSLATQNFMAMGTDLGGLERFFRGVQALLQIATSSPAISALAAAHPQLHATKDVLNVTRRFMRLFRFGDSFASAQAAGASVAAGLMSVECLLDVLRGTFFGVHGLLESVTVLDMAGVDVWGAKMDARLNHEALGWWTAALGCSIVATLLKMVGLQAHEAVNAADSFGAMETETEADKEKEKEKEKEGTEVDEKTELKKNEKAESETDDIKKETTAQRQQRIALRKEKLAERSRHMGILKRKLVADSLDIFIPLSGLMWVAVDPALLGCMMFVTTLMGFVETWGTY